MMSIGAGNYQKLEHDNSIYRTRAVFDRYAADGILKTTVTTVCFRGHLS